MPISLIINGYFRSGTSMLYNMVRQSNSDLVTLYEPMYTQIFRDALNTKPKTDCYQTLEQETLRQLRKRQPREYIGTSFQKWIPFFDVIHAVPQQVFLQMNRAFLLLRDLQQRYGCRCVQVIRNPADVYMSSLRSPRHITTAGKLESIRNIFRQKRFDDMWYVLRYTLHFARNFQNYHHYSCRGIYRQLRKAGLVDTHTDSLMEMLLFNWITLNHRAIKQMRAMGDDTMSVFYEDLLIDPQTQFSRLQQFTGQRFGWEYEALKRNNMNKYDTKTKNSMVESIRKYGLSHLLFEITSNRYGLCN